MCFQSWKQTLRTHALLKLATSLRTHVTNYRALRYGQCYRQHKYMHASRDGHILGWVRERRARGELAWPISRHGTHPTYEQRRRRVQGADEGLPRHTKYRILDTKFNASY